MLHERAEPLITVSATRAAYIGPGLDLRPHRNAAATLAIAFDTPFSLTLMTSGEVMTGSIALIPPATLHHLRASGQMIFLYLDALSDDLRQLRARDLNIIYADLRSNGLESGRVPMVNGLCEALGIGQRPPCDPRLASVIRAIDLRPQDFGKIGDAAILANLSISHFQHVFSQSVGMPFRRYRLWRRMMIVMRVLAARQTLTAAAYEAGFASSAHLSSSFKAMFGIRPSQLVALETEFRFDD